MNMQEMGSILGAECDRQHVGYDGFRGLLEAYRFSTLKRPISRYPKIDDVLTMGYLVDNSSANGWRKTPVTFANGGSANAWETIPQAMETIFSLLDEDVDPYDFVKYFEIIHPYEDGNGRVGFLLYNWICDTLDDLQPLPDFKF